MKDSDTIAKCAEQQARSYGSTVGTSNGEAGASCISGGMLGLHDAHRPSLREAANRQLVDAHKESRKAQALGELVMLLDKNPEVARILDLIELVRR